MIAYIKGKLLDCWEKYCIVLTQSGVGYKLMLSAPAFARLPAIGAEVEFYTSLIVREDSQELFGFSTLEEKQTFEILLTVSKIGARTALAILSVFTPQELRRIIIEGQFDLLTKVPGIGQKTAQHIFLELKYKLGNIKTSMAAVESVPSVFTDSLLALKNLGYPEQECLPVLSEILKSEPDLDVSAAIRQSLKVLAKGKM